MTERRHPASASIESLLAAGLTDEGQRGELESVASRFSVRLTRHVLTGAIKDPAGPVARQYVPETRELVFAPEELEDPIGDSAHSPCPGVVHRYPDRVLLTPTHACAVYCRFCFRREQVGGNGSTLTEAQIEAALDYVAQRRDVWEVILTGGDPLILSPRRLARIFARLETMSHVEVVRIHSRVPVTDPGRIDGALLDALRTAKALFVAVHANHADEFDQAARAACARFVDAGIPLLGQSVLLQGVNDTPDDLENLFRAFVRSRIKPYYLHHLDFARGTSHFRCTIEHGKALMQALRGRVSGLCHPTYVLDIPGGHGKVPIGPVYLHGSGDRVYTVFAPDGHEHRYADPADGD